MTLRTARDIEQREEQAEMSALGAAMFSPIAAAQVVQLLGAPVYHIPAHGVIHDAIAALVAEGGAVDMVTVKHALARGGQLAECGGVEYLIQCCEVCVSPANVAHYAAIVLEAYRRREFRAALANAARALDAGDSLADAEAHLAQGAPSRVASGASVGRFAELILGDVPRGVPSGFALVDDSCITGGWPRAQTSVVSATHKGGKTAALIQTWAHACGAGLRTAYATLADLPPLEIKRRYMRQVTGFARVPYVDFLHEQWEREEAAMRAWRERYYHAKGAARCVERLAAWIRSEHAAEPLDLVCVDYAQKLRTLRRDLAANPVAEADYCSATLSDLADDLGIAVVIGSQVTPGNAREGRVAMTKGSRAWEEDAGLVMRIEADKERPSVRHVSLPYSRWGPSASREYEWDERLLKLVESCPLSADTHRDPYAET